MYTHESDVFFQTYRKNVGIVVQHSSHVSINDQKVEELARSLNPLADSEILDDDTHYQDPEDIEGCCFYTMLAGGATNRGGPMIHFLNQEGFQGSLYELTAQRWKQLFVEQRAKEQPLTPHITQGFTAQDLRKLFGKRDDNGGTAFGFGSGSVTDFLLETMAQSVQEISRFLIERFDGSALNFVSYCDKSAARGMEALITLPTFADKMLFAIPDQDLRPIGLYKLAISIMADMSECMVKINRSDLAMADYGLLPILADNAVPRILYSFGAMELDETTWQKIKNFDPFAPLDQSYVKCAAMRV
jgi:hypothetical protein